MSEPFSFLCLPFGLLEIIRKTYKTSRTLIDKTVLAGAAIKFNDLRFCVIYMLATIIEVRH